MHTTPHKLQPVYSSVYLSSKIVSLWNDLDIPVDLYGHGPTAGDVLHAIQIIII